VSPLALYLLFIRFFSPHVSKLHGLSASLVWVRGKGPSIYPKRVAVTEI
jgi:hypothetical protein